MKQKIINSAYTVVRLILAGLFIYAGVTKIINPADFASDVDHYRILPYFFVTVVAVILPWMEVICGGLLLANRWVQSSSLLVLLMMTVFIIAIASAMARGLDIECGCFASGATKVGLPKLIEDIVLWIGAFFVFDRAGRGQRRI